MDFKIYCSTSNKFYDRAIPFSPADGTPLADQHDQEQTLSL
jgi:hypothetical protein